MDTRQHLAFLLVIWIPCSPVATHLKIVVTCVYGAPPPPTSVFMGPPHPHWQSGEGSLFHLRQPQQMAPHWQSTLLLLTVRSAMAFTPWSWQFMATSAIDPFPSAGSVTFFSLLPWHHIVLRVGCVNTMFILFKDTG